ncbi:hypothetical protein GCM10022222_31530 [Amycolatopsis ultiminotia]|uniref:ABM domain-containing protein n=1 Tax=Amycolatopsis ultiminotia TaxID=543629 RepID=A0ABP6W429_9PSEU
MFARVITVETGTEGFGDLVEVAEHQLPDARRRPGFRGFFLLTDEETGKLMTISLWETREQMAEVARGTADGIHDRGIETTGRTAPRLETYEVKMQA